MNQGSIRATVLCIKMITQSYRFTSLQLSKSKNPPHAPVTVAPLATHLPASYTTLRHITIFRGASHTFVSGPNIPSPHLPQYLYNTDFEKILWYRHSKIVLMSYISYMTNHYQLLELIMLMLLIFWSTLNPAVIRNHPKNLRPQKSKVT